MIQEVALGTGHVQLQCGHNTCLFDDFRSAQLTIASDHQDDKGLVQDFRASERFGTMISDFGYSFFDDTQGELTKMFSRGLFKATGLFSGTRNLSTSASANKTLPRDSSGPCSKQQDNSAVATTEIDYMPFLASLEVPEHRRQACCRNSLNSSAAILPAWP